MGHILVCGDNLGCKSTSFSLPRSVFYWYYLLNVIDVFLSFCSLYLNDVFYHRSLKLLDPLYPVTTLLTEWLFKKSFWVVGVGGSVMGEENQELWSSSHKISKSGDAMYNMVTIVIILHCIFESCYKSRF